MAFQTNAVLALNKTVNKKRVFIRNVNVPMPILRDFDISADVKTTTSDDVKENPTAVVGQPLYIDGVPVYANDKADFLMQAIAGKVYGMARNRFNEGVLKPGMSLAEDFEALLAETTRSGDALAMRREAKESFAAYLQSKAKSAAVVDVLSNLFYNSAKSLQSAAPKYVEALQKHVMDWIPTLPADKGARFLPKINELNESLTNAAGAELDVS